MLLCDRQPVPCYCDRQLACGEIQVSRLLKGYDYLELQSKIQFAPRSKHAVLGYNKPGTVRIA